jgi:hypothetical protein
MTLLHEHKVECDSAVWHKVEHEHEVEHKCEGEGEDENEDEGEGEGEGLFDLCYWQVRTCKLTG